MATLAETFLERHSALRAPIAGASPAGADITFDPDFERLKAEIDKQTGMSGTPPNWRDIETVGAELLTSKAKDMRVATWMTVAKMQRGSWEGFAEGLTILNSLVTDYWDTMFPEAKRARARANLVSWLIDQSFAYFEAKEVSGGDAEPVQLADEMLNAIDGVLQAKLGDLYQGLGKLRGTMREKVRAIAAAAPPPVDAAAPVSAAAAAPAPVAAAASAPSADLPVGSNADDALSGVRAAGKAIVGNAKTLRKADPAQAWPYRLLRVGAWLAVRQLPPTEGGKTRLPPPPKEIASKLKGLFDGEKWMDLLHLSEDTAGDLLFFFDTHRYSAIAMDRLGANFLEAREALGREVVGFVQRFPGVVKLAFSDGSPMIEPATKAWLDDDTKKYGGGGGGGGGSSAAVTAEDEEVAKRFESARELVTTGKTAEGLGLALALANRASDARARFRSRLAVATMALQGGKTDVARPMLESLMAEVESHHLETWEPTLCIPLYTSLLTCLRVATRGAKAPAPPELVAREAYLFDKLCRLDPAAALQLAGD